MADEVADYLAMAVIAIAALLDPEAIIVGGGTAEAGEDLLDPVRDGGAGSRRTTRPHCLRARLRSPALRRRLCRPAGDRGGSWAIYLMG